MTELMCAPAPLSASMDPPTPDPSSLWAIVLAGGEGMRLRPVIRHLYGDDRPKQFAALVGAVASAPGAAVPSAPGAAGV
jgi:hypothetical protein